MKKIVFAMALALLIGSQAHAEETTNVPPLDPVVVTEPTDGSTATTTPPSEDADDSKDVKDKKHHVKKERKANFGAIVSAEAHRLKEEGLNGKQKMGPWVSDQRRQNDKKTDKSASASSSAAANSAADAPAPKNSSTSGTSSHGRSETHRK